MLDYCDFNDLGRMDLGLPENDRLVRLNNQATLAHVKCGGLRGTAAPLGKLESIPIIQYFRL